MLLSNFFTGQGKKLGIQIIGGRDVSVREG